ncbi:hypothetical protein PUMCH_001954 [Australozyma saopauloensis]|uniref:non-specific serine/threonine protein kinase n=1 Tax=Australozyma saopauloensis TaxID=291208 RepID=A0AAX4H9T6_9ASCO|nr:hypothetical protein PUMCH_001954 [[Candida] saopauloensis]
MTNPPANAFPSGTRLTVGSHQVSILKYISQGGFAYVYTCTIDPPFRGSTIACLKRVVVPNKTELTLLRQEVDAMKRLRGNVHIVSYIDSHAARLPMQSPDQTQQYEVLLLMEYCSGLGLIDFMNTRLTQRLSEPEVLSIMGQITTAVAMCHHLEPPLIHRDIKIENVLIDDKGTYKLCDFGSAVGYCKVPTNQQELQSLHLDIMQHTTPQYRAPEMIDLSRAFPVDDKSDVWALGIFLYKLCYFTTPFELHNQRNLQDLEHLILSCLTRLRFPASPRYSSRLQNVIGCCLREDPRRRPNALQLLQEVCQMQNINAIPDVIPYSVKVHHLAMEGLANPPSHGLTPSKLEEDKLQRKTPLKMENQGEVFSKIDKSKLLKIRSNPNPKPRPKSELYPATGRTSFSSTSLHDMVKQQVNATSQEVSNMRKYDDRGQDTIEFLRGKEEAGLSSNQNTGGSFKASIRNGLRHFSTGGSVKSQRSGTYVSIHQNEKEKQPDESRAQLLEEPKRRSSIQRRVQQLLHNKDKKPAKTASGYGKYTDQDDISAINHFETTNSGVSTPLSPSEPKHPAKFEFERKVDSSVKSELTNSLTKKAIQNPKIRAAPKRSDSHPPPCPPGIKYRLPKEQFEENKSHSTKAQEPLKAKQDKKRPPPKPSKPQHLKVDETRNVSNSSDLFMPDLDDLEKLFSRRYPSYV